MTKERMPLISIVVPVYKVERFLEKCVKSILSQTVEDFELILVDDGSPDNCGQICDRFAQQDRRIQVIHQQNKGLSGARNAGIAIARGTYIGFVDSDDYVDRQMYEKLLAAMEREQAQIAICNFQLADEKGNLLDSSRDRLTARVMSGMQVIEKVADPDATPYLVAWNKLYRREIFETLRYDLGKQNEDTRIFNDLFYGVERVVCIEDALYYYVMSSSSIMRGKASPRNMDNAEAFYQCFCFYEEKGMEALLAPVEKRIFAKLVGVYYRLSHEDRKDQRVKETCAMHRRVLRQLAKHRKLSLTVLIRSLVFHLLPGIYGLKVTRG